MLDLTDRQLDLTDRQLQILGGLVEGKSDRGSLVMVKEGDLADDRSDWVASISDLYDWIEQLITTAGRSPRG